MNKLFLDTERLLIRNLQENDLADFYFYRSNPEVTKYQGFDVYTREESNQIIKNQKEKKFGTSGEWIQLGIENKETNKLIGDCAIMLKKHDPRIGEVGITISHTQHNKGYAREALVAILDHLFSIKGFHRVVEIVDVENTASIRLLESVGFRREGHFIDNIFFKGKWGSEYQYAMLRREWEVIKLKEHPSHTEL